MDRALPHGAYFPVGIWNPYYFRLVKDSKSTLQAIVRSLDFVQKSKVKRKPLGSPSMDVA